MAEINTGSDGKKSRGRSRGSKVSTKVDMTPMVDLAFLLITFFMLTTTFSKPQAMDVHMPEKAKDVKQDLKASHTLTVILGKDNKIFYYMGTREHADVKVTGFTSDGIKKILQEKKGSAQDKFTVVIKATEDSKYKNVVDMIDEVHIVDARYSIGKIYPADLELIQRI